MLLATLFVGIELRQLSTKEYLHPLRSPMRRSLGSSRCKTVRRPDPACSHPPHRLLCELGAIRAVDFAEPFETNAILLTTIGTDVAAVHLIACSTERSCQTIQLPPKFLGSTVSLLLRQATQVTRATS